MLLLILNTGSALGAEDQHLPLRNHNPLLQIFGLPKFQSGQLTEQGQSEISVNFDIANHSETGFVTDEAVQLDGESYYLNLSWRHGWNETLEVGIDLPFISHSKGFLDNPIEQWHNLFGLSNANREGPSNQLRFYYSQPGIVGPLIDSTKTGLGDIQLSVSFSLVTNPNGGLSLRTSLKLPTGDEENLLGSGAADFSLGLYHTKNQLFSKENLAASAFAGILMLGDGEILSQLQKDSVGFAGVSTTWQINDRFAINGQLYGQSAYFDSALDEIGGNSIQFGVGAIYRPANSRLAYSFGIVEDLFSDATTDVAFHFGVKLRRNR